MCKPTVFSQRVGRRSLPAALAAQQQHQTTPAAATAAPSQRRSLALEKAQGKGSLRASASGGNALGERGTNLLCSASSCSSLDLGATKLGPKTIDPKPLNRGWLNAMVPKLVKKMNKKRDLHTLAFVTFEDVANSMLEEVEGVAGSPELDWDVVLEGVDSMKGAEDMAGILVVKPLMDPQNLSCPSGRMRAAKVLAENTLRGSIGDCCDDEDLDFDMDAAAETNVFSSPEFADIFEEEFSKEEVGDRSYGIVLQSVKRNPLVDGCYILRTSTSRSVGCQCTHYSMSRALCGSDGTCMTVEQQVDQSWLVNPFTI